MPYEAKNFENLLGLSGLSDQLLKNHFTLYQEYVKNFNKLNDLLVTIEAVLNRFSKQLTGKLLTKDLKMYK